MWFRGSVVSPSVTSHGSGVQWGTWIYGVEIQLSETQVSQSSRFHGHHGLRGFPGAIAVISVLRSSPFFGYPSHFSFTGLPGTASTWELTFRKIRKYENTKLY